MRALTVNEWSLVAGGDGGEEPMEEVVVTGKRCKQWACLSQEELERVLEQQNDQGNFGNGGGGGLPAGVTVVDAEKALEKAMAETNEELRKQALVGAALAIMGAVIFAFPPSVVAMGVAGLVAKYGIAVSAAVLSFGGTWVFTDAMKELDNGE